MRRKTLRAGIFWRLIIALILALCLGLVGSNPAAALKLEDYFSLTSTVELSLRQVIPGKYSWLCPYNSLQEANLVPTV